MCGYISERHSLSLLLPGNVYRSVTDAVHSFPDHAMMISKFFRKQSACLLPEFFVLQLSHCCSSANVCMAAKLCCWLSGAIPDCRSLLF